MSRMDLNQTWFNWNIFKYFKSNWVNVNSCCQQINISKNWYSILTVELNVVKFEISLFTYWFFNSFNFASRSQIFNIFNSLNRPSFLFINLISERICIESLWVKNAIFPKKELFRQGYVIFLSHFIFFKIWAFIHFSKEIYFIVQSMFFV